ncbi:MAG: helix-hairpin-helix domain-containing protein [Nannocystaceae bacterium]|nr:helix-hairpin-helix domain-containing protein [Nannocystaceae bacterium]
MSVATTPAAGTTHAGGVRGGERNGRGWAAAAVLALALATIDALAPAVVVPARSGCRTAVRIDGLLRCDDEIEAALAAACAEAPAGPPLRGGDAIVLATYCHDGTRGRMPADDLAALAQPVDVNTAGADELASLPGVGPAIAARIVAGRPFVSVDALLRVRGIGPKTLARLRVRARVYAD